MNDKTNHFEKFRADIIGIDKTFISPFGEKKIVYADWIASGRLYKQIEETSNDDWENSFKVNVSGPFYFIRDLLSSLKRMSDSFVLTIGSGAGTIPMRGRSAYCSSKFALRGLILSLDEELKDSAPHMCLITLGSTITNFGNKSIMQKTEEFKKGKAYFPVEWVVNKLIEIIENPKRDNEITLFPGDHGFGVWKKP